MFDPSRPGRYIPDATNGAELQVHPQRDAQSGAPRFG
jgi:hypothetical protein